MKIFSYIFRMIAGLPKIAKNVDGSMMTRFNGYQALKAIYKASTPSNAHEDFYVGYPWNDLTYNDGSRLMADHTSNAYADHSAISEDPDALRLRTIHDPKSFQYNKTRSDDCTFGAWKDNPMYWDYASGIITHPKPFKMGRFEVVAKMPEGEYLWPSIWLYSNDPQSIKEIDIIEAYTGNVPPQSIACNSPTDYCHIGYANLHSVPLNPGTAVDKVISGTMVNDQISYACIWSPEAVLYYYEDVLFYVVVFDPNDSAYNDTNGIMDITSTMKLVIENKPASNSLQDFDACIASGCKAGIQGSDDYEKMKKLHLGKIDHPDTSDNGDMAITWFEYESWEDNPTYPGGHSSLRDYIISLENAIDVTFVNFQLLDIHRSDINYD